MEQVTTREKVAAHHWWQEHISALEREGATTEELYPLRCMSAQDNISFEGNGHIRPGKLGQWDVYYTLPMWGISPTRARDLAGLSNVEVRGQEQRMEMEDVGMDPDSTSDVAEHTRLIQMGPDDLQIEIIRLEARLGLPGL